MSTLFNISDKIKATYLPPFDPDALDYIHRVEAADEQELELEIRRAINDFVVECKSDGIWDAMKASCILAGARTISGALIPLKADMPAPTNFNFIANDYNRLNLKSDGSKYLSTNRAENADPEDNCHMAVYVITLPTGDNNSLIGNRKSNFDNRIRLDINGDTNIRIRARNGIDLSDINTGFVGGTRDGGDSLTAVTANKTVSQNFDLEPASSNKIGVFTQLQSNTTNFAPADAGISFYSVGRAINLISLRVRLNTLMEAYANILS